MRKLVLSVVCFLSVSMGAHAQEWTIGTEVEVDQGKYVTLYDSFDGWDVWKVEVKSGVTCHARKFESDKRQLPYKSIFFSAGTGLALDLTREGEVYWSIHHKTSTAYAGAEFRFSGDKFPTDLEKASYVNYGDALEKNRSQLAELNIRATENITVYSSDWEYRAARVGFEQLEASIALSGITNAESRLIACRTENL